MQPCSQAVCGRLSQVAQLCTELHIQRQEQHNQSPRQSKPGGEKLPNEPRQVGETAVVVGEASAPPAF